MAEEKCCSTYVDEDIVCADAKALEVYQEEGKTAMGVASHGDHNGKHFRQYEQRSLTSLLVSPV